MADVVANITLNTTGGDAAASEIQKASVALQSVTTSSSQMQSQFQHRFQHIGLMLFAGDALRASGLGMEARQIINTMNMALMGTEAAAGLSGGAIALLVTGMVALAALAEKVASHHKDESEALTKLADTSIKHADAIKKELDQMDAYVSIGGKLSPLEKSLYDAKKQLLEATTRQAEIEMTQAIPAIQHHIVAVKEQMAHMVALYETVSLLSNTWLFKYIPAFRLAAEAAGHFTGTSAELTRKIADIDTKLKESIATIAQYRLSLEQAHTTGIRTFEDTVQSMNKVTEAVKEIDKETKKTVGEMSKDWNKLSTDEKKVADEMGKDFGQMAGGMILQQQTLTQVLNQLWRQMAQQFINYVAKMIAEWLILQAVMASSGVGLLGGGAISGSGADITGGGGGAMATGGSIFADRPTLALFGEGGPEVATFTPMGGSSSGGGGGGGDTYNVQLVMNANGITDPDQLAKTMGQKLVQMIRGQGQLSMVRS